MARTDPEITDSDVSSPGITVLWPTDPRFRPALAAECDPPTIESLEPVLPYSVLLQRNSERRLYSVTVRRILTDSQGRENLYTLTSQWGGDRQGQANYLLTPTAWMSGRGQRGRGARGTGGSRDEKFRDLAAVRVEVDSVVFADGWLVGPDVSQMMEQMTAWIRADEELAAEVLATPRDALRSYLDGIVALPRDPLTAPGRKSVAMFYRDRTIDRARSFLMTLEHAGEGMLNAMCRATMNTPKVLPYR